MIHYFILKEIGFADGELCGRDGILHRMDRLYYKEIEEEALKDLDEHIDTLISNKSEKSGGEENE